MKNGYSMVRRLKLTPFELRIVIDALNAKRLKQKANGMFDQLVALRGQLDLAKSQASQSDTVNAEVARIMEILKHTDMSFTEFDDVTVRRLIDCIQVCGNQKIIVTLKGGYQAEEELRRTEVA